MKSKDRILLLASSIQLGHPDVAGKSLADIIMFLLTRIPKENRAKAIQKMKSKILNINQSEISQNEMPDYASMGQSISFIKNILAGHDPDYVRMVLDAIARNLG
jgi:transcription termination factor NusB